MDVEPEVAVEQDLRDEDTVGGDDDRLRGQIQLGSQTLGLQHGDAEALGRLLGCGRREQAAASARAVRACQAESNLVPAGQELEHVGAKRRRRGERNPRHIKCSVPEIIRALGGCKAAPDCVLGRPDM